VSPDRLKSVGLGEANPIASNDTAEGRQQNRRVMLIRTDSGM
jgi:outer membrane protein OmpA-like peptidoglycan-associated protein